MNAPIKIRSFYFTHVWYNEDDSLGFFLGLLSLLPQVIVVSLGVMTLTSVDEMRLLSLRLILVLGLNELLNIICKQALAQIRPTDLNAPTCTHRGYGMPSSHAQFMGAFVISVLLYISLHRTRLQLRKEFIYIFSCCGLLVLTLLGFSRVYTSHHTVAQVFVGTLLGVCFGSFSHFCVMPRRCLDRTTQIVDRWIHTLVHRIMFQRS